MENKNAYTPEEVKEIIHLVRSYYGNIHFQDMEKVSMSVNEGKFNSLKTLRGPYDSSKFVLSEKEKSLEDILKSVKLNQTIKILIPENLRQSLDD